ncbi:hypothetical protein HKD37_15G041773 [Glycine soja]
MSKLTNEEHEQWCEMAKITLKVVVPPDTILNTVSAKDQIYGEVSLSFVVRWKDVLDRLRRFINEDGNFHTVVYNQDLDKLVIVAGWTTLRDFYHVTAYHQVSLTHYVACPNHSQDDTHYSIKCQILSLSRCISLRRKTFQTPCIIFLKIKAGLIRIWMTLQNVGLCSITGERHLKLELDENIYVKPYP